MLRCSFLSPTHVFIRKAFLVPHNIFKERGVFKLSNRRKQFKTRSNELKLKPRADWSTIPGTLCSHLADVVFILEYRIRRKRA